MWAGTSTGAIIATLIALGKTVDQIREFYIKRGAEMFEKRGCGEVQNQIPQRQAFRHAAEDNRRGHPFGSEKLETLLMVVLRKCHTDWPWPLSNNPDAKYNLQVRRAAIRLAPVAARPREHGSSHLLSAGSHRVEPHEFIFGRRRDDV
jgi:hypothetical protein